MKAEIIQVLASPLSEVLDLQYFIIFEGKTLYGWDFWDGIMDRLSYRVE